MQPVITEWVCQNIRAMFHFCLIIHCCCFPRYFFAILHDLCCINSLLLCTPHLQFGQLIILLKFFIQSLVSVLGRQTTVDVYKHTFPLVLLVTCRKWVTKCKSSPPPLLSYIHISLNMLTLCCCMHVFYLELTFHIFYAFVRSLNIWHLCHCERSVKTKGPRKQLK
jgi:hypothetical protein